ncbi:hypothetical protein [Zoogloea sp.]
MSKSDDCRTETLMDKRHAALATPADLRDGMTNPIAERNRRT